MTAPGRSGVRVAVLRVGTDADAVCEALRARGVTPVVLVVGTVEDRADDEIRDEAGDLSRFAWVAVTSAHAARRLAPLVPTWPTGTMVAAVGATTAAAVERSGLSCTLVAPDGTAASLARAIDGGPVLYLASARARTDLVDGLHAHRIDATTVVAYDVTDRRLDESDITRLGTVAVVLALAPRGIDALLELDDAPRAAALGLPLVVIGPTTEARATAAGIAVARRAARRDPDSIADAVAAALG